MCGNENGDNDVRTMNREILKGRIYPAIQSCMGNRYKILVSFFAFYSFILNSDNTSIRYHFNDIKNYGNLLFAFFTLLNSYNYFQNSKEQSEKERLVQNDGRNKLNKRERIKRWMKRNDVELGFILLMGLLILLSWLVIKDC